MIFIPENRILVFDLDGTLIESGQKMSVKILGTLAKLPHRKILITGGRKEKFDTLFPTIPKKEWMKKANIVTLYAEMGAISYRKGKWSKWKADTPHTYRSERIREYLHDKGFSYDQRDSNINITVCPSIPIRLRFCQKMSQLFHYANFTIGGTKSVDCSVHFKGKRISEKNYIFFGDRVFPYGNDYEIARNSLASFSVENPEDTQSILRQTRYK